MDSQQTLSYPLFSNNNNIYVHPETTTTTTLIIILKTLLLLICIGIVFRILAHVCDRALEPCMEALSDRFNLPFDIACATFLAAGSSVIEIVINCFATISLQVQDVDLSFGTIFGSALLAFTVIPALCVLYSPNSVLHLEIIPLLRDCGFFTIALIALMIFSLDGEISTWESLILIGIYFIYLIVMFYLTRYYIVKKIPSIDQSNQPLQSTHNNQPSYGTTTIETPQQQTTKNNTENANSNSSSDDEDDNPKSSSSSFSQSIFYIFPPFNLQREKDVKKYWPIIFITSIFTISILADICLSLTKLLAQTIGLSSTRILGMVLIAIGAHVDDIFASIALSKKGRGPGSIANAIGSQVITITVGIGLPFLISNLVRGTTVHMVHNTSTDQIGVALIGIILCLIFSVTLSKYCWLQEWGLTRLHAIVLVGLWIGIIGWIA
jgi:Ca2+/Na+ antiporter